jgi:outer membrane biogenesis lipoprotein LolB
MAPGRTLAWLAGCLRMFIDRHPGFEVPVDRLASWLAGLDHEGM